MVQTEYWEHRYKRGGVSGEGSLGKNREWKWSVINSYVKDFDDVIDVGCGDLSFWAPREISLLSRFRYFGLDISPTVIQRNRTSHPRWSFHVGDAAIPILGLNARIVLCLDLLFHIMDDAVYLRILENLCRYSHEWIFVFTWCRNPFNLRWRLTRSLGYARHAAWTTIGRHSWIDYFKLPWALIQPKRLWKEIKSLTCQTQSDGIYQRYRKFEDYEGVLEQNGFKLTGRHENPYSKGTGALYVFRANSAGSSEE